MKEEKGKKIFVELETGEYFEVKEGDKIKIIPENQQTAIKKSYESKKNNKDIEEWNNSLGGFVFVLFKYSEDIMQRHPEVTSEDITKLFYLSTYVDYDGYLIYNDSFMSRGEMNQLLKIARKNFDIFFNKMKDLSIFIQDKNKNIKVNKEYFCRGELDKEIKEHYNYTRLYIKTIRYLFENVDSRYQDQLGLYFKMIPYIHRQQNTLSWNPDSSREDMRLMHVNELKELLNYNSVKSARGFIRRMLQVRLENGEAIVGFFRTVWDEGESYIIVNPKVFYSGNFALKDGKEAVIKWFSR